MIGPLDFRVAIVSLNELHSDILASTSRKFKQSSSIIPVAVWSMVATGYGSRILSLAERGQRGVCDCSVKAR
jgi:hypothetical protein